MLRRKLSTAVKLSDVAEKTTCGAMSQLLPGSNPFTVRFMWIVSPGRGGSERLHAMCTRQGQSAGRNGAGHAASTDIPGTAGQRSRS